MAASSRMCLSVIILGVSACLVHAQAEDRCRDILINGTQNEYHFDSRKALQQQLEQALRLDDVQLDRQVQSSDKKGGGSISGVIGKYILGAKGGGGSSSHSDRLHEIRNRLMNDERATLSEDELVSVSACVADENIIRAWSDCMKSRIKEGFQAHTELIDTTHILLKLRWTPLHTTDPDKIRITSVTLIGMDYPPAKERLIDSGTYVGRAGIDQLLVRTDKAVNGIIVLNTDWGPYADSIPATNHTSSVAADPERELQFYKDFVARGSIDPMASNGVFKDRIRIIWGKLTLDPPADTIRVARLRLGVDEHKVAKTIADLDTDIERVYYLKGTDTSFDDTDVLPGKRYIYQIRFYRNRVINTLGGMVGMRTIAGTVGQ